MTLNHDEHEYYGGHSIEDDPHVYDNGVLINFFNIRATAELGEIESQFSGLRGLELHDTPIYGRFDLDHARKVHFHLFQDVYPWAGELRAVDISKGGTEFTTVSHIVDVFDEISKQLAESGLLVDRIDNEKEFSAAAGIFLGRVNQAHPFREGNGRTQRQLLRLLAQEHGYSIDWSGTSPEAMKRACIDSTLDPDCKSLGRLIFLAQRKLPIDQLPPPTIFGSKAFENLHTEDLHSSPDGISNILHEGGSVAPRSTDPEP